MITIYTITYNEELMLPYFIQHYRDHFPGCKIVVYDNQSTDGTQAIARSFNCEVITYDTGNTLSDSAYLEIKNNCWKDAETDWVLVADCDELCFVTEDDLRNEKSTVLSFEGYNMVNLKDDHNIGCITHGVRAESYDKSYCFNKKFITEINYGPGCHSSNPKGKVIRSINKYDCLHYKYINPDFMVNKFKRNAERLSPENKKRGWGVHYTWSEDAIRKEFEEVRKIAVLI